MKNVVAAAVLSPAPLVAFGQFTKTEVERWTKVVERGGIKPE